MQPFCSSKRLLPSTGSDDNDCRMTSSSEPLSAHEIPDDGLKSTAAVPLAAVDEPMDAFVVEDYPPLTAIIDYPYGSTAYPYTVAIPGHAERQSGLAAILNYQPPSPAQSSRL